MRRTMPLPWVFALAAGNLAAQAWHLQSTTGYTGQAMAYDSVRDRVVLFTHSVDGARVQEWDGTAWLATHVPGGPTSSAAGVPRLAFDTVRRQIVVLIDGSTWYYDGATWQLADANGPGRLDTTHNVHAWDPQRQVLVYREVTTSTTHEWNGTVWRAVVGPIGPFGDLFPCLGYDPIRQCVLATLPRWGTAFRWDGQVWSQIGNAVVPLSLPVSDMAVGTDPVRNRLFLFGGTNRPGSVPPVDDNLWVWDGTSWTAVANGPQRRNAALSAHVGTGTLLLYGGDSQFESHTDTWTFDTGFHRRDTQPCLASAITDPVRQRIVALGCAEDYPATNQTWEWNGWSWQPLFAPQAMPGLLLYDSGRDQTLALENNFSLPRMRTWLLTATGWQLQNPVNNPGWQPNWTWTYDPVRQVAVLFGALGGTWEWDGTDWSPRPSAHAPAVAWNSTLLAAAFDPNAQRVRMLARPQTQVEDWEWDGTDWTQTAATGIPQAPFGRLAFDPVSAHVVFCGSDSNGANPGTWERIGNAWTRIDTIAAYPSATTADPFTGVLKSYQQGTWYALRADLATVVQYGQGCGAGTTPTLTGVGRSTPIGADLRLEIGSAPGNAPAALYASLAAGNLQLGGGCTLLLGTTVHFGNTVTSSAGGSSLPIPIPDQPALIGLDVFWQGAALQNGGPLLGTAALTNGVRVHIGH